MSHYSKNCDKTLSKAIPTVREDGIVKSWELEVVYSYPGEGYDTTDAPLRRRYEEIEDVEYLGKTPQEFTKSELFSFLNIAQYNLVFDSTYESVVFAPTEKKILRLISVLCLIEKNIRDFMENPVHNYGTGLIFCRNII